MRIVIGLPLLLLLTACGATEQAAPPAPPPVAPLLPATALDDGGWRLPEPVPGAGAEGISRDGSRIVLEAGDGSGRLLVLTPASGEQHEVDLRSQGAFRYDALSRDGRVLFLNEHQGDQIVRIRMFDVGTAALLPDAVVDKIEGESTMSGTAVARDTSADGSMVYTLYRGPEHAFVHALMVDGPASFCIDLPGGPPLAGGTWSIAVRSNGAVEVVAGGSRHLVAAGPDGFPVVVPAA